MGPANYFRLSKKILPLSTGELIGMKVCKGCITHAPVDEEANALILVFLLWL